MRRLVIERMTLDNVKGTRHLVIDADGRDLRVLGDNATGKTTLHDAFTWCLFGTDGRGRADFGIKTVDADGRALSGLDHAVEVVLREERDTMSFTVTLRRTYREKWTKRRGSSQAEFTGHETQYHVDGVPTAKREYDQQVDAIAPAGLFRLLTDPLHFSGSLHWTERRDMLLSLVDPVQPADVVARQSDLQDLIDAAGRHTLDAFGKVLAERRKGLNRDLQALPVRVDEASRQIAEHPPVQALEAEAADARARVAAAHEALQDAQAGGALAALRSQRVDAKAAVAEALQAARGELNDRHTSAVAAKGRAARHVDEARSIAEQAERDTKAAVVRVERLAAEVQKVRAAWVQRKAERAPEATVADTCPACGQHLPDDQVRAAHAAHADQWRTQQATDLERLAAQGQEATTALQDAEARLADLKAQAAQAEAALLVAEAAAETAAAEAAEAAAALDALDVDAIPAVRAAVDALAALQAQIEDAQATNTAAEDAARQALAEAQARAQAADRALAEARAADAARARVQELRDQERQVAADLEACDRLLHLADEYTRMSVAMLTERINGLFTSVQFRLFADQINGGLSETCDTTVNGVLWADLNHGAQINAGLDIIATLARHHGFAPPVWIDNAEAVTRLRDTPGQQVRLIVSADHPTLTVAAQEGNA